MKRILSREETKSSGSQVLPHQQVFDWQGQYMTDEPVGELRAEVDRLRGELASVREDAERKTC